MRIGFLQNLVAKHLKKPDGFVGKMVAILMNKINAEMNVTTLVKEIHRVLKENGRLILTFRSREGMSEKNGFTLYSADEVVELALSAGFRSVSLTSASDHLINFYSVIAIK